ncbi:hypothetical protein [Clostridium kluyveri]|uniref:hypothetical protein n=1 Tax=Clostridium kluyveri TaxID=1534 RepID=UPI00224540AA|nr:hypothetical protein [Clostridium kluyveri]UZQ49803.1 hypothetical protein OP486_17930 [Clostridium kluyveri]
MNKKVNVAAPEEQVQEQTDYTTEYKIDRPSRLILTTSKNLYDEIINECNGIPLPMVCSSIGIEEICLSQSGQLLYVVQIPVDK